MGVERGIFVSVISVLGFRARMGGLSGAVFYQQYVTTLLGKAQAMAGFF